MNLDLMSRNEEEISQKDFSSCDSKNPLFSIIVITYNSSVFVLETLESAKNQAYQNIELIISDDGSTDETVAICM